MKASLLLVAGLAIAVWSIVPANAAPANGAGASKPNTDNKPIGCSFTSGRISPVPCGPRHAVNYEACRTYVMEHGATSGEALWWCTSQGYTK